MPSLRGGWGCQIEFLGFVFFFFQIKMLDFFIVAHEGREPLLDSKKDDEFTRSNL